MKYFLGGDVSKGYCDWITLWLKKIATKSPRHQGFTK